MIGLGGVAHSGGTVDCVMGAPAHSFAGDEAGVSEVADDSLGCPFGDPELSAMSRNLTLPCRAMHSKTWVWLVTNRQGFPSLSLDI